MKTLWLVNGAATGVDPSDRGLAFGDGLFETMAASDGRIRWLDYHLERLAEGCGRLAIAPLDFEAIRAEIAAHCPGEGRAVVKLIVTRGSGPRGYRIPEPAKPTRILGISTWHDRPQGHYTDGIVVQLCRLRLGENPDLAGLKHLCRLEQVLAHLELRGGPADQGLLLDGAGRVVGGSSANVFAVFGAELVTPSLARCGVRGVMRRVVLEAAAELGIAVAQRDLTFDELQGANELFMTNALIGILPVALLDGRRFRAGAVTRRLQRHLGYALHA